MMTVSVAPFFPFIVALILFPYNIIGARKCYDALDIVHIQDVSPAFHRFWPKLTARIDAAMKRIKDSDPDVYFGLATFEDKNITGINQSTKEEHILGSSSGYCLRVDVPLQQPNVENIVEHFNEYQRRAVGGGDSPAGVFEALYRGLTASKLRWRRAGADKKVYRFVVGLTGATSHLRGDVHRLTGQNVRPFDITAGNENENYDCDKVGYPTLRDVSDLLLSMDDIDVLLFVAPGGTNDSEGRFTPYESLAGLGQEYQKPDGLWEWYGKQYDDAGLTRRTSGNIMIGKLDGEMANYADFIGRILSVFKQIRC